MSEAAKVSSAAIEKIVRAAMEEDAPWGDITSQTLIPAEATVTAQLVAREAGVLCGQDVFRAAMELTDVNIVTEFELNDGETFAKGDVLATVTGPARGVLQAERVALNLTQRLSAIATMTSQYVAAAQGTKARIVDTRKTTPGLRVLERYAVRCGGGHNHRFSLSDAVMVKDNHVAIATRAAGGTGRDLGAALRAMKQKLPHTTHVEVEVDRIDQIEAALEGGADSVLLDNFSIEQLREGVSLIGGRAMVEASGGVTLDSIAGIAATGVDVISVGALTHSVRALDLGLDIQV